MPKHKHPKAGSAPFALARQPLDAKAMLLRSTLDGARAAYETGRLDLAERVCRTALDLQPDCQDALRMLGLLAAQSGRSEEAVRLLGLVLAADPKDAEAHVAAGAALASLGRHAESLERFESALGLQPDDLVAHYNRGAALLRLGRIEDSLAPLDFVLARRPDLAEAWNTRGVALRELHRHLEAIECFEKSIALKPAFGSAHWSLGVIRLLLGDFEGGWREYPWRLEVEPEERHGRNFVEPMWHGTEPIRGKSRLLYYEHGLGDTLQYCRYATDVAELGANVLLEVQPPLYPLLERVEGATAVYPAGARLPHFDYRCPMMNLPFAFRSDLGTIPRKVPYVRSEPAKVRAWQSRLGASGRTRVGLAWAGPSSGVNAHRNVPLATLIQLLETPVQWMSLHKHLHDPADANLLAGANVLHFGEDLRDFSDTAALIELADLVITIDTSVAHLAGAMGKEVWILLPYNPVGWIWMLDREDSVWYPTARLFRQERLGDWSAVVENVRIALQDRLRFSGAEAARTP